MYVFKNLTHIILELKKIRAVYQTLIKSIINYGISDFYMGGYVWNNYIDPLKKILKTILKKDSKYNKKYLYNDMIVLPVNKLFCKASVFYMIKIKNNLRYFWNWTRT